MDKPMRRTVAPLAGLSLAVFLPPLAVSLALVLAGLPAVVESGMCPGAPPDIAAYACPPGEYLLRMTLGPWALFGHILVFVPWACVVTAVGLSVLAVRQVRSMRTETATATSSQQEG